jgi:hypothetical protein
MGTYHGAGRHKKKANRQCAEWYSLGGILYEELQAVCGCLTYDDPNRRRKAGHTQWQPWDFSSHACIIIRFFSFFFFEGAFWRRQMGQRMNYDLQDKRRLERRRNDDVLALALLIFRALGNGRLLLCFPFSRGIQAILIYF